MDQFKKADDAACTLVLSLTHEAVAISLMTVVLNLQSADETIPAEFEMTNTTSGLNPVTEKRDLPLLSVCWKSQAHIKSLLEVGSFRVTPLGSDMDLDDGILYELSRAAGQTTRAVALQSLKGFWTTVYYPGISFKPTDADLRAAVLAP